MHMNKVTGRWIQKLGEERKALPLYRNFIFYPYNVNEHLYATQFRRSLIDSRPLVLGDKAVRIAKDTVYNIVKEHINNYNIKGPYLGLAANHAPEIYSALYPHVQNNFVTCQNNRKDFNKIEAWMPEVANAYSGDAHPVFQVKHEDIIEYMFDTPIKFPILDMDFMGNINKGMIADVTRGIRHCAADTSIFALWHSYGHTVTKEGIDKIYHPYLVKRLDRWFDIQQQESYRYREAQPGKISSTPMQVDLFVLRRRSNEQRRRSA